MIIRTGDGAVRNRVTRVPQLDFSRPCIIGFGSSPSRCGPSAACRLSTTRPPDSRTESVRTCRGLRPCRVVRELAITRPFVWPSAYRTASAPGIWGPFQAAQDALNLGQDRSPRLHLLVTRRQPASKRFADHLLGLAVAVARRETSMMPAATASCTVATHSSKVVVGPHNDAKSAAAEGQGRSATGDRIRAVSSPHAHFACCAAATSTGSER